MENIMKNIYIIFIASFLLFSCNEVVLSDAGLTEESTVIAIKIDPPVAVPGDKITINTAITSPDQNNGVGDISIGNIVFTASDKAEVKIPEDISGLFGEKIRKSFKSNGYVDIPVNVSITGTEKSAVKYFRIAGSTYEASKFDINPEILSMTYEVIGSADKIELEKDSVLYFQPSSIPEEIEFDITEIQIDDLIMDEYYFEWIVTGDSDTLPELAEFDEKTGKALFSFRDDSNAPVVGDFRFYLIISPKKSYQGTRSARYGIDFFTFFLSTKGEPLEDDDTDTISE